MSTREERLLAGRMVFTKVIQDDVKAAFNDTRDRVEPLIDADGGIAAELPDGTRIGSVKRSKPRRTPQVTDPAALLAWVREHRPEELVERVSPAFESYLKDQCRTHGAAVYAATGEIVPGVEMVEGAPSFLPRPDESAVPLVRARYAELVAKGYLALPSADDQDGAA